MATEDFSPEPMTREEAKRILRRLELDAYSAVVTAFRAQGDMNKSKKSILGELSNQLSISTERHRAEVRRVVNDDRLNDVAECMHGPGTSTEWGIEGCRLVSLMPRLVPQTVFTAKATAAANQALENNQKLPIKSEIEVLPLPTKVKGLPPKSNQLDSKDDKPKGLLNDLKLDDKFKKKKKSNILYTKPSPLALNKTLMNSFKPSLSTPSTLKSMGKNTPLKSLTTTASKSATIPISSASVASAGYPPKPVILQRSPSKGAPVGNSKMPTVSLQSLAAASTSTTPINTSNNIVPKGTESASLAQPMIKVVSNSQNIPATGITAGAGGAASSITQKIKFKTPLPKPKVKATKFKPLVPLQRPNLLSSNQSYGDSIVLGSGTTATVTVTSTSPNKSLATPSQGMSVKVVQVTKSSSSSISSASLLMSGLNKPVVVVSNGSSLKAPQKLTFSGVPSSVTQQLKVMATASTAQPQLSASNTNTQQAKASGALTSKSMPLATGFKMIAVTTVVPGTTQVKTVYIATPIMSLPKTVSQSSNASITTAAPQQLQQQNVRHISSSLASNLQTVVARSINPNNSSASNNKTSSNIIQTAAIVSQPMSTPSSSVVNKNNKLITNQPKGLGSYKTTLAGTAQSLKLFTATTKSKTPHTAASAVVAAVSKSSTPLLPSASLLASSSASSSPLNSHLVNQQRLIGLGGAQNTFTSSNASNVRLRPNSSHLVDNKSDASSFLNIGSVGGLNNPTNGSASVANAAVLSTTDIGAITTGDGLRSLDEVSATLSLLNNDGGESNNMLTTEQITATATGETDDMAFLNAGEKFLEKLTAKMTAASPDSMSKATETFLFPTNLSLDINEQSVAAATSSTVFDDYDALVGSSISIGKGGIAPALHNGNLRQPALLAKDSSSLISNSSAAAANNSNFFLAPSHNKVGVASANAILSSTKLLNNILPSGTKVLPTASNALSIGHYTQNAIVGQSQHHQNMFQSLKTSSDLNSSSLSPSLQQPSATSIAAAAAILNYTNITNVSGKNTIAETTASAAADLNKVGSSSGFITVGSNLNHQVPPATVASSSSIVLEASGKSRLNAMKMNSSSSNKLPMSIPGSSKLNISPLLSNNKVQQGAPSSSSCSPAPSPSIVGGGGGGMGDSFQQDLQQQQLVLGNLETSSSVSSLPKQHLLHNNLQFYNNHTPSSPIANDMSSANTAAGVSGFLVDEVPLNNNECPPRASVPHQSDCKQGGGVKRKASDVHNTTNAASTSLNSTRSPVSWVRSAANLLARVSKFRGVNKQKGDLNAASWFTKPVDPSEEPGYYGIIKTPMDFGKIKRKLEDGEYDTYTQFYEDMLLVKKNCYAYNPAEHIARKDCDSVFNFFEGEYRKLLERWEKHHLSPHKRQRLLEENGN